MQVGLEGLPRSGKSYTCVKDHIIPALRAGRRVVSNIEGLNAVEIAKLIEKPVDEIQALLIHIENHEVRILHEIVLFGDLVCVDECHSFWPLDRKPLSDDAVQFFAMHGHMNLDIVLMTQLFSEVHRSVVARLERKNSYTKKSVIGKPNDCHVNFYQQNISGGRLKWIKIDSKTFTYDPQYFPCYSSFYKNDEGKDGGQDYSVYGADEAKFWSLKMKLMVGFMICATLISGFVFIKFLKGGDLLEQAEQAQKKLDAQKKPAPVQAAVVQVANAFSSSGTRYGNASDKIILVDKSYVTALSNNHRARLGGYIHDSASNKYNGYIEWRTQREQVYERLSFDELKDFGYSVNIKNNLAYISKGNDVIIVTTWPLLESRASGQRIYSPPERAVSRASESPQSEGGNRSTSASTDSAQIASYGGFRE